MSVSLSQVQGALQGFANGGASGPLTLTVLQKTEAITAALKALTGGKPVSVEVLSAQANGRAAVSVGGLTLQVKASLPLKVGDVFALNVQQTGYNLKLVQPLTQAAPQSGAEVQAQKAGALAGQKAGGAAVLATNTSALPQNAGLQNGTVGAPPALTTNDQGVKSGGTPAHNVTAPLPDKAAPQRQTAGSPQSTLPPVTPRGGQAAQSTTPPGALPANGAIKGAAIPSSGLALGNGVPTVNIIRAVAEALPALAGKVQTKADERGLGSKGNETQGKLNFSVGQQASGGQHAGGPLNVGRGAKPLPAEVTSNFLKLSAAGSASGAAAGGVIEEIAELLGRGAQKGPDVTLDFPLGEAGKSLAAGLYILPDQESGQSDERQKKYAVSFSLETVETGPVHAEVILFGQRLTLQLWAEVPEFYERLDAEFPQLQQRIEAAGLTAGALRLRRGRPRRLTHEQHWDTEI